MRLTYQIIRLLLALAIGGMSGLFGAQADRSPVLAHQTDTFRFEGRALFAIDCPSPRVCYAAANSFDPNVGEGEYDSGTILATRDGGARWSKLESRRSDFLDWIVCPSARICYAHGQTNNGQLLLTTIDSGRTWRRQLARFRVFGCRSTTFCYAARPGQPPSSGGNEPFYIDTTTDGGRTWHQEGEVDIEVRELACPSAQTCYAAGVSLIRVVRADGQSGFRSAGAIVWTHDGGTTWNQQEIGGTAPTPSNVVCPSVLRC